MGLRADRKSQLGRELMKKLAAIALFLYYIGVSFDQR